MNIPNYVKDLMSRAKFDTDYCHKNSLPGYTIKIRKASAYSYASTLATEINKLAKWARKHYAEVEILECPSETHHYNQYAYITITDPVMIHIEQYIPE